MRLVALPCAAAAMGRVTELEVEQLLSAEAVEVLSSWEVFGR